MMKEGVYMSQDTETISICDAGYRKTREENTYSMKCKRCGGTLNYGVYIHIIQDSWELYCPECHDIVGGGK